MHGCFLGNMCSGTSGAWKPPAWVGVQDGVWEGDRILPEGWVAYSATPTRAAHFYGAGWWLGYPGARHNPASLLCETPLVPALPLRFDPGVAAPSPVQQRQQGLPYAALPEHIRSREFQGM